MAIFAEFYLPQLVVTICSVGSLEPERHHPAPACDTLSRLVVLVSGPFLVELTVSHEFPCHWNNWIWGCTQFSDTVPLDFRSGFTIRSLKN